jgi:hypothetical protein
MKIFQRKLLALGFLLAFACMTSAEESDSESISFSFDDQHKNSMNLKPEFKKPIIVTVADKKGSEELLAWIEPLTREFGDTVNFFPIADLRKVPGALKGMIRRSFRKQFEYNVAMDWKGVAVEQLSTKPNTANLILLNKKGHVVMTMHGEATAENIIIMIQAIRAQLDTTKSTPLAK